MIILTGASGGIGRKIIPELLKLDSVIGLYNKTIPSDEYLQSMNGNEIVYYQLDVTKHEELEKFKTYFKEKLKNICLIHLAAKKIDGLALAVTRENWDQVFDVNVKGTFLLTQSLLPLMMKDAWGRIIFSSSSSGIVGDPGALVYNSSKAALSGISRTLAKEYARFNITSNILNLGYFDGGLFDKLPEKVKKELIERIPSRRLGTVINISNTIACLIQSDFINGSNINIDGGI